MIAPVCRQPVEGWFDEHLSIGVHQAVFVAHGEDNVVVPHLFHAVHGQVAYDFACLIDECIGLVTVSVRLDDGQSVDFKSVEYRTHLSHRR